MRSLSNKVALVTGASRGIGRATAKALADSGAHVLVHYGNAATEAEGLVAEIRTAGGSADALQADLSSPDGAIKLAKQVKRNHRRAAGYLCFQCRHIQGGQDGGPRDSGLRQFVCHERS